LFDGCVRVVFIRGTFEYGRYSKRKEMEKLPETSRTSVVKMSEARLTVKLQQAGYTVEDLEDMDRSAMLNAWAEIILAGRDQPEAGSVPTEGNGVLEGERRASWLRRQVMTP
jgi:hypothetical protein